MHQAYLSTFLDRMRFGLTTGLAQSHSKVWAQDATHQTAPSHLLSARRL